MKVTGKHEFCCLIKNPKRNNYSENKSPQTEVNKRQRNCRVRGGARVSENQTYSFYRVSLFHHAETETFYGKNARPKWKK